MAIVKLVIFVEKYFELVMYHNASLKISNNIPNEYNTVLVTTPSQKLTYFDIMRLLCPALHHRALWIEREKKEGRLSRARTLHP